MIELSKNLYWEQKYVPMLAYYYCFLKQEERFLHLITEFSNLRGALTENHFCYFSHELSKDDMDYFGSGVQFIVDFGNEDLEIILDFETFLEKLSEIIAVFLESFPNRKEEVNALYKLIKDRIKENS